MIVHRDGDARERPAQEGRANVESALSAATPPRTVDRRAVLRYGAVGVGGVVVGALGGFTLGRSQVPAAEPSPSTGGSPGGGATPSTTFPVRISDTGRGFIDAQGRGFFYFADTAWNAPSRMTREEFETLATARRDAGFTGLQVSVLDFRPDADNAYGNAPFTAVGKLESPAIADDGDDYWTHVQWCIQTCRDLGLVACLVPSWYGGWGDAWRGYVTEPRARAYGAFLAERFGQFDNVWWLLGGDNDPDATGDSTAGVPGGLDRGPRIAETIAMGRALQAGASDAQLMSYHTARGLTAEEYFGQEEWYGISAAYSRAYPAPHVATEYARRTVRPVVLWEAYYAERDEDPILDRRALRAQAYHSILSGAAGFSYGHEAVHRVREDWADALGDDSSRDIGILSALLTEHAGAELTPVAAGAAALRLLPDGYGDPETASAVSAATLPDARGAMAYFGEPRDTVLVDTTALDPTAQFEIAWADPASGEEVVVSGRHSGVDVTVPWPSDWSDAVLILRR